VPAQRGAGQLGPPARAGLPQGASGPDSWTGGASEEGDGWGHAGLCRGCAEVRPAFSPGMPDRPARAAARKGEQSPASGPAGTPHRSRRQDAAHIGDRTAGARRNSRAQTEQTAQPETV